MLPSLARIRSILLLPLLCISTHAFLLLPSPALHHQHNLPPTRSTVSTPTTTTTTTRLFSSSSYNNNNNNNNNDPFHIQTLLPSDLRLIRIIGEQRLTIEEEIDPRDGKRGPRGAYGKIRNPATRNKPFAPSSTPSKKDFKNLGVGVRLFEAIYTPTGERVIMKEFLPLMKNLAMAEVEMYRYLYQWAPQTDPEAFPEPIALPLVPLLGYLQTGAEVEDPSFTYDWAERFGASSPPPRAGNTWLALRTPGLLTLTAVPRLALSSSSSIRANSGGGGGGGLFNMFASALSTVSGTGDPWTKKLNYLKAVMLGAIDALSLLHQAGVCHGSVSPSTLCVSTADIYTDTRRIDVRLSALGLARNAMSQEGVDFVLLVKRDWRGCAYALLEVFLRLLADETEEEKILKKGEDSVRVYEGFSLPFAQIEAGALQRVCEEEFKNDISMGLRSLISQEPSYKRACEYLDAEGGRGWTLLQDMANPQRLLSLSVSGGGCVNEGEAAYVLGEQLAGSGFLEGG